MVNNKTYFYLGGFISLFIFLSFTYIAVYMMTSSEVVREFALEKKEYISISIEIPKIEKNDVKKVPIEIDSNPVVTPVEQKKVNVDDLFSDIWTRSIKKKKPEKVDKKILQEIAKKIKRTRDKKVESIANKYENSKIKSDNKELSKSSSAKEVNEYFAKIQAIVYNYFYPPQNSQGHKVKAIIILGAFGKVLDFRILQYSSNLDLNNECDKIKQRLLNIVFPVNPKNESGKYTILLTSKE
jgi:protein TonB